MEKSMENEVGTGVLRDMRGYTGFRKELTVDWKRTWKMLGFMVYGLGKSSSGMASQMEKKWDIQSMEAGVLQICRARDM